MATKAIRKERPVRARNVKPGFFKNEELPALEFAGRLLFIGLWLLADKRGLLEDRPLRIKAEVFPYDDVDVHSLLTQLARHGFILRYEVEGKRFIQVVNFLKHQSPHPNEKASVIPLPQEMSGNYMKSNEIISDSLNPDSLNPDSLNPEKEMSETEISDAPQGKAFSAGEDPYDLAAFLRERILENDERAKVPSLESSTFQNWCLEMDRLIRIDKRSQEEIAGVIDWCQNHKGEKFSWASNILSASSLRKHFTRLLMQAENGGASFDSGEKRERERNLLDKITAQKDLLRKAAERVRSCSCDLGYIRTRRMEGDRENEQVQKCECLKAWGECYRELQNLARSLEDLTGRDCDLHLTADMTDFSPRTTARLTDEQKANARARLSQVIGGIRHE